MNKAKSHNKIILSSIVSNESGSILLTTIVILLLMTLIGISGMNTASTDLQITRNYRIHKQNLALADAAVNMAKSLIAYEVNDTSDSWVNDIQNLYNADPKYFNNDTSWDQVNTPVINEIDVDEVIADWDNNGTIAAIKVAGDLGRPAPITCNSCHSVHTTFEAGDFALMLPDEKHCYKNTSDSEDLVMICAVPKEFE